MSRPRTFSAPTGRFLRQTPLRLQIPAGLDLYMPVPDDNPLSAEGVALGEQLFFDPILSRNRTVRCATCHDPQRAFTDGHRLSIGIDALTGTRHAPTLVNRGYGQTFFWDGRASRLEDQVLQPIENPTELALTVEEAIRRLNDDREYFGRFQTAFAQRPNAEDLARALASYVRTILSGDSPVDRYLNGDREALEPRAREGLRIFRGKGRCTACHLGPNFSDERHHNTGVAWRDGVWTDPGRFGVTGREVDHGAFKTPTLREVGRTAPYMHDGSLGALEDVLEFYDRGGNRTPYLDPELHPLQLTAEEKRALIVFLQALSGAVRHGIPARPA